MNTKAFLLALVVAGSAYGAETVTSVSVRGARVVDQGLILRTFNVREGEALTGPAIQEGIRSVYGLGLFEDVAVEVDQNPLGLDVVVVVVEYPKLGGIEVLGNDEVDREDVMDVMTMAVGSIASPAGVKSDVERIRDLYEEKGYLLATITSTLLPIEGTDAVTLRVTIREGDEVRIRSITFEGNTRPYTDHKLRKQMKTHRRSFLRSGRFERERYREDLDRVMEFYRDEGFLDAEIAGDSITYDSTRKWMDVVIYVRQGDRYRVGDVSFEGFAVKDSSLLRRMVVQQKGAIYSAGAAKETVENLYALYSEDGYIYLDVDERLDLHDRVADVRYVLEEGPRAHVRRVLIEGNSKTKDAVIRRELSIFPGDVFHRSALMRSQRDVFYLDYFSNVEPRFEFLESGDVDLIFAVQEKPVGQAQFGAGYSQRDKFTGNLGLSIPNFRGAGQTVSFAWDFGKNRNSMSFGFTDPWAFGTPTLFGFKMYQDIDRSYTYYDEETQGLSIRVGRRLRWPDRYTRATFAWRIEDVRYYDFDSTYANSTTIPDEYNLAKMSWPRRTSAGTWTLTRDDRNIPQFATRGTMHSLLLELAGGPFGGSVRHYKVMFDWSWHFPTFADQAFVVRGRLGHVDGLRNPAEVLYSERFFPGGTDPDGQIRGYDDRTVVPYTSSGVREGGRALVVTNVEYQVPVIEQQLYLLAFFDAGRSWRSWGEVRLVDVSRGVGFGGRFSAPLIGIIGLDLGYALDDPGKGRWRTHFQFGTRF